MGLFMSHTGVKKLIKIRVDHRRVSIKYIVNQTRFREIFYIRVISIIGQFLNHHTTSDSLLPLETLQQKSGQSNPHKCCLDPFLKRPLITEDLFCSFFIFKTSNNCEPLKTDNFCQIIGFENLNVFVIKRCDIAIIEVESCPFLNCFVFDSDRKPKAGVLGSISSGLTF